MNIYRQGDLALLPIESLPAEAKPVPRGKQSQRLVLAAGEQTGHAHVILDRHPEVYATPGDVEEMRRRFLRIETEVAVVHPEHAPLALLPGTYEVLRQVEYAPAALRRVRD